MKKRKTRKKCMPIARRENKRKKKEINESGLQDRHIKIRGASKEEKEGGR